MFRPFPVICSLFLGSLLVSPAFSADPASTEDLIPVPDTTQIDVSEWGGFYLGIYGGYEWFNASVSGAPDPEDEGLEYGGYVGYNWQFPNKVVTGFELLAGLNNTEDEVATVSVEREWDASLRARLGYAFEKSLIYSFAGLAVTSIEAKTLTGGDRQTFTGFNVGSGVEVQLFEDVTGRIEYEYDDFSSEDFSLGGPGVTVVDPQSHSIKLGIGLQF